MSNIYNLEPPTKGKVILKTTLGDIDVELWPKEAPKAVRNFVQLCMEGYYDGTTFHRIVRDFMAQGGDATGTGRGEDSIYGHPFADEFHSRLKFNHRGLMACANANAPHSNGSQFFITLDATNHLDRKNTIFGKVTGDSIYNVMHLNELETDEDDRPVHPPRILEVEVLWNPFEDIVPRSTREEREAEAAAAKAREEAAAKRERGGRKKNLGLLSFGEEAQEEDEQQPDDDEGPSAPRKNKIVSAHDVLEDARLLREKTAAAEAAAKAEAAADEERARVRASVRGALARKGDSSEEAANGADRAAAASGAGPSGAANPNRISTNGAQGFDERMRAAAEARRREMGGAGASAKGAGNEDADEDADEDDEDDGEGPSSKTEARRDKALEGRAVRAKERLSKRVRVEDAELLTDWQRRNAEFKQRRKIGGAEDAKAKLERLRAFQRRLRSAPDADSAAPAAAADAAGQSGEAYNGQVRQDAAAEQLLPAAWRLEKYLDAEDDDSYSLGSLRGHKLVYNKERPGDEMARKDNVDDLEVVDPLQQGGKKYNRVENRQKKMQTEWAAKSRS